MGDYLYVKQVSKLLGITERQVRKMCRMGDLPGAYRDGGYWLIPRVAVEELIVEDEVSQDDDETLISDGAWWLFKRLYLGSMRHSMYHCWDAVRNKNRRENMGWTIPHFLIMARIVRERISDVEMRECRVGVKSYETTMRRDVFGRTGNGKVS